MHLRKKSIPAALHDSQSSTIISRPPRRKASVGRVREIHKHQLNKTQALTKKLRGSQEEQEPNSLVTSCDGAKEIDKIKKILLSLSNV
jgi:hypothetical protein